MNDEPQENPLLIDELEARTLIMAIPVPNEGTLSQDDCERIVATLNSYAAEHDLTSKDIGRSCKISESVVSEIRNGKYEHSTLEAHLRSLNNWMEVDARRRKTQRRGKPLTDTFVVKLIRSAVDLCRQGPSMGYVTGPAGIGKTVTIKQIAKIDPGAIYVLTNRDNCTHTKMLRHLCNTLKVSSRIRSLRGMTKFERISSKLSGSHRMLFVDDADKLSDDGIELLREMHDAFGIPILLIGVVSIARRIEESIDEDRGQLSSRFGVKFDVRSANTDHNTGVEENIFSTEEIRKILTRPGIRLSNGAVNYLLNLANSNGRGGIRVCEKLVQKAERVARKKDRADKQQRVTVNEAHLDFVSRTCDVMSFDPDRKERLEEAQRLTAMSA